MATADPSTAPRSTDPADLLDVAVSLARAAGELVRDGRRQGLGDIDTKSTPTDLVTTMDTASERLLVAELARLRPGDSVMGEEGGERAGSTGVRWLVDPIDGTVNYVYGIPEYAVSVAAEAAGEVVAGAVFNPESAELFSAHLGGGAFLGDRPLRGSDPASLALSLVGTGFSYDARRRADQARVLAGVLPRVRDIRRIGSAALDLCAVAAGRFDAYYEAGLHLWDYAAGALIAREAGAVFTVVPGAHDLLVAAAPAIAGPLVDLLVELGATA